MNREERRVAKMRVVAAMARGQPWDQATQEAGLPLGRSTAYRLVQRLRTGGEATLTDDRHGHPSKLRGPVREWLVAYCRGAPAVSGRQVCQALHARFGLTVSVRQINRVRAALGVGRQAPGAGKKPGGLAR